MKIAIVGGGAAGLMTAVVASQKHNVTVFERQNRVGKKLFASGNGKCNVTNSLLTRQNLSKPNDFYNCQRANDVVFAFDYDDFMSFCKNRNILSAYTELGDKVRVNVMKKKVLFAATVVKTHIMEFHIPYLKLFQIHRYIYVPDDSQSR